jgi:hypothetical protein
MNLDTFISGQNGILAAAIWGIMHTLKLSFPAFIASKLGQRLLPVFPLAIGTIAGLAGAVTVDPNTALNRAVLGLAIGGLTAHIFKVAKTSLMAHGLDEDETPPTPPPAAPPADAPKAG